MKNNTTKSKASVLFEIKKINKPYLILFYTLAWGLQLSFKYLVTRKTTKKAERQMVGDLAREFRLYAQKANIVISSRIGVEKYLDVCWRSNAKSTPGYDLAMGFYQLSINIPSYYHPLYFDIVREAISLYSKGKSEMALKLINGASRGGIL